MGSRRKPYAERVYRTVEVAIIRGRCRHGDIAESDWALVGRGILAKRAGGVSFSRVSQVGYTVRGMVCGVACLNNYLLQLTAEGMLAVKPK